MKKSANLIDCIVILLIFIFLLAYFKLHLLFSLTTTTGGDTGSHYPTALYLKEVLFPAGKILGWDPGNYAGYPLFYHYFPLTFIIMAILNFIIPMQIAFKLVSVMGTFLLPVCTYWAFRWLRYKFPIPIMATVFSLPFLFMEANSMWGANIPSTLAGEYSYSFSFALLVLFWGGLYYNIEKKQKIILNALLFFCIALSHAFTFILSGAIALFFLFDRRNFWPNFWYLFRVFGLGGLLFSFWLIPFLGNVPFVTSYVTRWAIASFLEVFPVILLPFIGLSLIAFFLNLFDRRTLYYGWVILISTLLYFFAPHLGMLDIRFIPFIQFFLTIFGATIILVFMDRIKSPRFLPFIIYLLIILWVLPQVSFIRGWIKWNYEGVEMKKTWPLFKQINDYLKQFPNGRVVYEHSPANNGFGTERAFENLPHFAKRQTLEGLYMQSSISAPFVFYIQSEVSKVCSGPFPQYKYTQLNLPAAISHLLLFNVTHYLVRSPEAKKQADSEPALKLEKQFGDYSIYRLLSNDGHYVTPLKNAPVRFETDNWKQDFFEWFRRLDLLEIPLVYIKNPTKADQRQIPLSASSLLDLPAEPIKITQADITEKLGNESLEFKTNLVGYPHLIKISYHPNWQVSGADKLYLISPSFMLVYPQQPQVKIWFSKSIYNYAGEGLTLIGLTIIIGSVIMSYRHARKT